MQFNYRTKHYLKEMEAVKIDSKYKVFTVNFNTMKAFVNKQDTYKKRNGKTCHVEHHFGKWMPFTKSDISHGMKDSVSYDTSVNGTEVIKGRIHHMYLTKEVKERLVEEYQIDIGRKI